jgi:hypothetical protein
VELPGLRGHLILRVTLKVGGPCGLSSEAPRRVPSRGDRSAEELGSAG